MEEDESNILIPPLQLFLRLSTINKQDPFTLERIEKEKNRWSTALHNSYISAIKLHNELKLQDNIISPKELPPIIIFSKSEDSNVYKKNVSFDDTKNNIYFIESRKRPLENIFINEDDSSEDLDLEID